MNLTHAEELATFRGIKRACYAGLDSVTLRQQIARRAGRAIAHEAYTFSTTDPDTGLITHAVREGVPDGLVRAYVEDLYPNEHAWEMLDRARSGQTVSASPSPIFMEALQAEGIGHEMNAILTIGGALWGYLCLLREQRSRAYDEREVRFLARLAPHVARGLKAAALRDAGMVQLGLSEDGRDSGPGTPGVIGLDARLRVVLRNSAVREQVEDLSDFGVATGETPYVIASAVAQLYARHAALGDAEDGRGLDAMLRARGRSGRWYTIYASLVEPDTMASAAILVLIEPARAGDAASILTRLYGLSRREREVVALAAKGASTKEIAARLNLSPYTVQDHFGHACEKVGVRGRKALLAKLFFDHYAPGLSGV